MANTITLIPSLPQPLPFCQPLPQPPQYGQDPPSMRGIEDQLEGHTAVSTLHRTRSFARPSQLRIFLTSQLTFSFHANYLSLTLIPTTRDAGPFIAVNPSVRVRVLSSASQAALLRVGPRRPFIGGQGILAPHLRWQYRGTTTCRIRITVRVDLRPFARINLLHISTPFVHSSSYLTLNIGGGVLP